MRRLAARFGDPLVGGLLPRSGAGPLVFAAALLAFLAVLALALTLAAGRLAESWRGELANAATLQIVAPEPEIEAQARAALAVLRTTPGVRSVRMVDVAEQERLLQPWLGSDIPVGSLPLPLMVEVEADRGTLDQDALVERLQAEAPGSVYDDHAAWREPLVATAERVRLFAGLCLGLLALGLASVVSLAARAAVAAHAGAIGTLRLVGAQDGFIRRAVTRPITLGALGGALAGTAAGAALVGLLPSGSEQGFYLAAVGLEGWSRLLPAVIPAAALLIAWAVGWRVVRRSLRRRG